MISKEETFRSIVSRPDLLFCDVGHRSEYHPVGSVEQFDWCLVNHVLLFATKILEPRAVIPSVGLIRTKEYLIHCWKRKMHEFLFLLNLKKLKLVVYRRGTKTVNSNSKRFTL